MSTNSQKQTLIDLIDPVCVDLDLELVEIEISSNPKGPVLRVYIDRLSKNSPSESSINNAAVGINECEALSRQLSALMDVEDPMPYAYSLEVSSPGLDRPLRTLSHYQRFIGEKVKIVLTQPLDNRRRLSGTIVSVDLDEESINVDCESEIINLKLNLISTARLIPDWNAIMSGTEKSGTKKHSKPKQQSAQKDSDQKKNIRVDQIKRESVATVA